eukprot:4914688-Prymnesium_polylepis.2
MLLLRAASTAARRAPVSRVKMSEGDLTIRSARQHEGRSAGVKATNGERARSEELARAVACAHEMIAMRPRLPPPLKQRCRNRFDWCSSVWIRANAPASPFASTMASWSDATDTPSSSFGPSSTMSLMLGCSRSRCRLYRSRSEVFSSTSASRTLGLSAASGSRGGGRTTTCCRLL